MEPDQLPPKPQGMSDQMWQQMLQFMFSEGPAQSPNAPFLSEDDTSYVNSRLTQEKKANDYISDPASRARLGTAGYGPEQFQATRTYEAVSAPAYQKLMMYAQGNDPVSRIIAETFLPGPNSGPGTAREAVNNIMLAYNKPGHPDYEALRAMPLLASQDRNGNKDLNIDLLMKDAQKMEDMVIADPFFNSFDPDTGLPANLKTEETAITGDMVQRDDGSYATVTDTPTEAMRYFDEMGLSTPYETYDQSMFASPEILEREAGQYRDQERAMTEYLLKQQEYDETDGQTGMAQLFPVEGEEQAEVVTEHDKLMNRIRELAQEEGSQELGLQGLITNGPTPSGVGRNPRSQVPSSSSFDAPMARSTPTPNRSVRNRDDFERQARQERGGRKFDAMFAKRAMDNANNQAKYARGGEQQRAAMSRLLAQQGYTPFNEQMGYMNRSVYG